jgi:hypothetical protein
MSISYLQRSLPSFNWIHCFFPRLSCHLLCCCKVERLFSFVAFFACVTCGGWVFSLFNDGWSNIPFCHVQGTLVNIVVVFYFLAPISNMLVEYALDLQELHTSITNTHSKVGRNMLGLDISKLHDFLRLM